MAIQQILSEHQRLVILRLLHEVPGFDLNESILQDSLNAYGLDVSRDSLRTQLAWLAEQGLLSLSQVGTTQIAKLSARGQDVAEGRASVPGIKRPSAI